MRMAFQEEITSDQALEGDDLASLRRPAWLGRKVGGSQLLQDLGGSGRRLIHSKCDQMTI